MSFTAKNGRNKLWFGTEERMTWFPTPLRGADVSSTGWESGGTLLNGGGFQLNSFGSARNFMFEWPQSSSRQAAQMMKSYADGTYGRGLIYFQDPLTWTTNVLPAMWADPSIGLGYEGASLVYGVDPEPIPTSAREQNDLPVRSAYYDLGGIDSGWRGKEQAVFVPIPEGMSLALGVFYTQTGSGGVFYREQSTTGALGTQVLVSGLSNSSPHVVDTIIPGGNAAGVWLYVGKSASGSASVTLSGMVGRLIETGRTTSELKATNLFTNPRLVGDGTWAEVARFPTGATPPAFAQPEDFRVRDLGTGESVMEIEQVAEFIGFTAIAGVSTKAGEPAVRLIPREFGPATMAYALIPVTAPSVTAVATVSLDAPLQSPPDYLAPTLSAGGAIDSAPNLAGAHPLRAMGGEPDSGYVVLALYVSATPGDGHTWWTDIGLYAGDYGGPAFNGSSGTVTIAGRNYRTQWDGTPDNSTSSAWSMTPELDRLKEGPWVGGQGHSGCRFVGKPTYINNTGVDGGQVSFAASFKEVGSWLYG